MDIEQLKEEINQWRGGIEVIVCYKGRDLNIVNFKTEKNTENDEYRLVLIAE
jgi:hypothetical protein